MNRGKFIRLLNLYIDNEASAAEVREVEEALHREPAFRRIHDEYRQIQAATRALGAPFGREDTRVEAGANRAREWRAAAGAPRRGNATLAMRRVVFWCGGSLAACAALAVAFLGRPSSGHEGVDVAPVLAGIAEKQPETTEVQPQGVAERTSFAAPFAAQMRIDPFLIPSALGSGDPFSLDANLDFAKLSDAAPVFPSATNFTLQVPVLGGQEPLDFESLSKENRKLRLLLRRELGEQAPAEFRYLPARYPPQH